MTSCTLDVAVLSRLGRELERTPPVFSPGDDNRAFLIRSLLRVRDKQGRLVRLAPNRAQREFAARATGRDIVLKARQLGITTWVAARYFVSTITRPGTLTVQVAHDQCSAEEIFRIVHRFLENLPEGLRQGALVTSRANVRQIVFPRLDSEYRVETAADPDAGRGLTIRNLHCSEVARWPGDAAATLASLLAAVPGGGSVVLESTANGAAGCFYDEWQRAGETGYQRHFFPWWYAEEYAVNADGRWPMAQGGKPGDNTPFGNCHSERSEESAVSGDLAPAERALIEAHGLTLAQIAFRRQILAAFRKFARQEYAEDPVSCFLASGECFFELEPLEQRRRALPPPLDTRANSDLLTWYPPRAGGEYVIGADPAGGGSDGDYCCAQVIESATGLQCAELRGHYSPREFAQRLAELGRAYNDALLAVERNNHGQAVIVYLEEVTGYPNLYQERNQTGFLTTPVSRPRALEYFASLAAHTPELFCSARLLDECRAFVRQADGTSAAASGAHDDCVLAMAIAQHVRLHRPAQGCGLGFASVARE